MTKSKQREVLIARCDSHLALTSEKLDPIWPVTSDDEFRALKKYSELYRFALRIVPPRFGLRKRNSEIVVGLGTEYFPQAELDGHLTGRSVKLVPNLELMDKNIRPTVVVTCFEHISNQMLGLYQKWVGTDATAPIPGFVLARNSYELWQQVVYRSVSAQFPADGTAIWIAPDVQGVPWNTWEGKDNDCCLKQAIGCGSGITILHTHSDGIDAKLPNQRVLCSLSKSRKSEAVGRHSEVLTPKCIDNSYCHRLRAPLSDAMESPKRVEAAAINTAILLLDSCSVFQPWRGLLSEEFTLLDALISRSTTGVVITNCDSAIANDDQAKQLAVELSSGITVSAALKKFLNSPVAKKTGRLLAILGDPNCSMTPMNIETNFSTNNAVVRENNQGIADCFAGMAKNSNNLVIRSKFIKACFGSVSGVVQTPQEKEIGINLMAALDEISVAYDGERSENFVAQKIEQADKCILELLIQKGITERWMTAFGTEFSDKSIRCDWCGSEQKLFQSLIGIDSLERLTTSCPLCGITGDVYKRTHLKFSFSSPTSVLIASDLLNRRSQAVFSIWAGGEKFDRHFWWPRDVDGFLLPELHLGENAPKGLVRISLWLCSNLEVCGALSRRRL